MSNELKRRQSRPSKRPVRHDARAEPADSSQLPEPEALVTRARRPRSIPAMRAPVAPPERRTPPEWQAAPREARLARQGGAGEASAPVASQAAPHGTGSTSNAGPLLKQIAALQLELAQAQRRLATMQEERAEDADRLSDMLARLSAMETSNREADERVAKAESVAAAAKRKAEIDDAGARAANDAVAEAERRAAEELEQLTKVSAELDQERATSQWLRTAGEQTTREATALRARLTEEEARAKDEREELAKASARVTSLEQEQRAGTIELEQARTWFKDASFRVVALEEELRATKADALGVQAELRKEHEEALALTKEEEKRVRAEHHEALRVAKDEQKELRAEHEEALARAKEEQKRVQTAHDDALQIVRDERGRLAESAKGAEERIRRLEGELKATSGGKKAVEAERDALSHAKDRSEARAKAVAKQLEATTEMLAILNRSLEALEQSEEQAAKLRGEATTSRQAIADQTVALRLAFSRAVDAGTKSAAPPPLDSGPQSKK